MQTPETHIEPTRQVCNSCKARKRKCDKALPKCTSCAKRKLACEYSTSEQTSKSSLASNPFSYGFLTNNGRVNGHNLDLPTISFLDPGILQHGQLELPRAFGRVPVQLLDLLGDMNTFSFTAAKFFRHIHPWMPFISRNRFYECYLNHSFQAWPDIVLLFLTIKLITTLPLTKPRNARTPLYHAAKHLYLEVEGSSIFSLPVLQAGLLIALYELGHAIYPAAYLTIGACARYAFALGINLGATVNPRKILTLVETEERRRVWWAIVILDRFASIGCPGRPFATAHPSLDDLLPTNDAEWDQGIVRADDQIALSTPMTIHMSKFALLCQAARLLDQVLEYVSKETRGDNAWIQLDRTLESMINASLDVDHPDHNQIAFIFSALIALHTTKLHPNASSLSDSKQRQRAREVVAQITNRIKKHTIGQQCFMDLDPEDMTPWGLFFGYQICWAHMHLEGVAAPNSIEIVKALKETFAAIDMRWNAAGVYLQLLEAREVLGS